MAYLVTFLISTMLLLGTSCNEESEKVTPHTSGSIIIKPVKTPKNTSVSDSITGGEPAQTDGLRTGMHDFTLHWISWEKPGKVKIEAPIDGWYTLSGRQSDDNGNFITIAGKLRVIKPTELQFVGTITERYETLNMGDTCIRNGEQVFLSTKNRKYWRLQNMANCEGSGVVDYIDIYF